MLRIFYGMLLHGVRSTFMLKLFKVKVNISKYILTCIYTLELYILSVAFLFSMAVLLVTYIVPVH